MKKITLTLFLFIGIITARLSAQNVGINTDGSSPDSKAMLDVKATGSGFLMPRMAWASRPTTLTSTQNGLMIYSSDGDGTNGAGFYYYKHSSWLPIMDNKKSWSLLGNSGTTAGTNFLGTTDNVDLVFKTQASERARFLGTGELLVNSTTISSPAGSGDKVSVYVNENTDVWSINGINTTASGGSIYAENTNSSSMYNALVGQVNYTGTTSSPNGVFGLSVPNTGTGCGVFAGTYSTNTGSLGLYAYNPYSNTAGYYAIYSYGRVITTGNYYVSSDERLKKNITSIKNGLEKVMLMNPVEYDFDEKYKDYVWSDEKQFGFLAQELEKIFPNSGIVSPVKLKKKINPVNSKSPMLNESKDFKAVSYTSLIPFMVSAIQEQQKLIENQQIQIDELKNAIEQLKKK
jgi:hypothetical protein